MKPIANQILKIPALVVLCLGLSGCVKLALKSVPSFIPHLSQTFFEECDVELAKQALPASLKIMEGLLKNDPENKQILTALCSGFTGYAMLFVEDENPENASSLYLRARDYGLKALGRNAPLSKGVQLQKDVVRRRIEAMGKRDLEPLFWTTMAWNAWIKLNLDKPAALGQLNTAQVCLVRLLEINADYYYGTPYILMGSMLAAMPEPLGGDEKEAKQYFEKAMQVSNGKFFLAHYYFARYYAVRVQDKALFFEILEQVEHTSANALSGACLINAVIKEKTKRLQENSDDLFL